MARELRERKAAKPQSDLDQAQAQAQPKRGRPPKSQPEGQPKGQPKSQPKSNGATNGSHNGNGSATLAEPGLGLALGRAIGTRRDLFAAEDQRRATLRYLTPDVVDPNPEQPRQTINREGLEELKKSISERGILQPLLAVKGTEGHVTLVAGQRRLLAARELGLKLVPVMVIDYRPDVAFDAIIENIQREALDPIDEGEAFQRLAEERNLSHAEIGERIGKSKQYVTDRIRISQRLTRRTKELLANVVLPPPVALPGNPRMNARAFDSDKNNNRAGVSASEEAAQGASRAKFSIARSVSFLPDSLQDAAMAELESEVTRLGRRLTTREVEELVTRFKAETPKRRPSNSSTARASGAAPANFTQMSFIPESAEQAAQNAVNNALKNYSQPALERAGTSNGATLEGLAGAGAAQPKMGRARRKSSQTVLAGRHVDGRQLESFKTLAELMNLSTDQALSLDLDLAIQMMEADLERLRRLKNRD